MALAETVCMDLSTYYQVGAFAIFVSLGIGILSGALGMKRHMEKKYSSR